MLSLITDSMLVFGWVMRNCLMRSDMMSAVVVCGGNRLRMSVRLCMSA